MKQTGALPQSLESGELRYTTSGFLTLQFEIQNYFSKYGVLPTSSIYSRVFRNSGLDVARPESISTIISEILVSSSTAEDVLSAMLNRSAMVNYLHLDFVINVTIKIRAKRPILHVPLYSRAFPTRHYLLVQTLSIIILCQYQLITCTRMYFGASWH